MSTTTFKRHEPKVLRGNLACVIGEDTNWTNMVVFDNEDDPFKEGRRQRLLAGDLLMVLKPGDLTEVIWNGTIVTDDTCPPFVSQAEWETWGSELYPAQIVKGHVPDKPAGGTLQFLIEALYHIMSTEFTDDDINLKAVRAGLDSARTLSDVILLLENQDFPAEDILTLLKNCNVI